MLLCSGCGGLVSEYAARCPDCGRGVDDAVEISEPPRSEVSPVTRGVKNHMIAPLLAAAVLVIGAAGIVVSVRSGGPSVASGLRDLDGRIVAESPSGAIVRIDPAGGATTSYSLVGSRDGFSFIANSPDGTAWLDSAGDTVTFSGIKIAETPTAVQSQLTGTRSLAGSETFADKGQAVVVLTRAAFEASDAEVATLDGRFDSDLGPVDSAGGDPQTLGAFVSAPAPQRSSRVHGSAPADADVELREAGQSPKVLATSQRLNADVGLPGATPTELEVFPSPSGDAVAIVLSSLNPVETDAPMVILNRDGGLLAALTDWQGPMYGAQPVWSPGGRELVYPTRTPTGAAIAVTTVTGAVEALSAPSGTSGIGSCVWAPSSGGAVCDARRAHHDLWLYTSRSATRLIPESGRGRPIAWIASSL
jgi:hypothetical protein